MTVYGKRMVNSMSFFYQEMFMAEENAPTPDPDRDPKRGQAKVPEPPTREEIEEISRAQQYITDDWTGEGGKAPKSPDTAPDEERR